METKEIKCPSCGFKNAYGTKKCYKCHTNLVKQHISCPKCAKKNKADALKCENCGFNFKRKRLSLFTCLLISVLIAVILFICVRFYNSSALKYTRIIYCVLAIFIIISILYTTLTYGRKEQIKFDAEEEMSDVNPRLNRMKLISKIAVVIISIAIGIFIILKYVLKIF